MNLYHFHPGQDLGVLHIEKKTWRRSLEKYGNLSKVKGLDSHEILLVCYIFLNYGTYHIL